MLPYFTRTERFQGPKMYTLPAPGNKFGHRNGFSATPTTRLTLCETLWLMTVIINQVVNINFMYSLLFPDQCYISYPHSCKTVTEK